MAIGTFPGMLQEGDHASRPAASAVGSGTLYACSDHGLIYQSDGSSWATWATLGGGGGGGATREYLGTTTVGGTSVALGADDWIAKKITPANDCDMVWLELYTAWVTSQVGEIAVALYSDNAGVPLNVIGFPASAIPINNLYMNNGNPRWLAIPLTGAFVAGTSYWPAVKPDAHMTLYYDGGGSDHTRNQGSWTSDWGGGSNTGRNYSFRVRVHR